jgi:hypothetical protein
VYSQHNTLVRKSILSLFFVNVRCDETWDPLLDQGLVDASGSFVLLTFALKGKAR